MSQNNDDIEALKAKLYRLDGRISAMPAAQSSSIIGLRDELTRCAFGINMFLPLSNVPLAGQTAVRNIRKVEDGMRLF